MQRLIKEKVEQKNLWPLERITGNEILQPLSILPRRSRKSRRSRRSQTVQADNHDRPKRSQTPPPYNKSCQKIYLYTSGPIFRYRSPFDDAQIKEYFMDDHRIKRRHSFPTFPSDNWQNYLKFKFKEASRKF